MGIFPNTMAKETKKPFLRAHNSSAQWLNFWPPLKINEYKGLKSKEWPPKFLCFCSVGPQNSVKLPHCNECRDNKGLYRWLSEKSAFIYSIVVCNSIINYQLTQIKCFFFWLHVETIFNQLLFQFWLKVGFIASTQILLDNVRRIHISVLHVV